MNNRITFSQLDHILVELGFRKKVIPGECVTYDNGPTKSLLAVRLHTSAEAVPEHTLVAIRLQLNRRGVITESDFEALLQSVAA